MASQGERVPGVVGMDGGVLESMAQDGDPEQEMLVVEEQELPQTDPEPEMGAVAAVAYDTSPPLPHQNPPPIPAETAHPGAFDMAQLFAVLARMENKMEANTNEIKNEMEKKMEGMTQTMRNEMRQVGQCLQAGKMAPPRAAASELGGECNGCQARGGGG